MSSSTPTFAVKDDCVCIADPSTNEAYDVRIVAIREKNGQDEFKVHYHGWSKSQDAWVPESKLFKGTFEEYRELYPLKEKTVETPKNGGSSSKAAEPKSAVKSKANGAGPSSKLSAPKSVNGSGAGPSQLSGAAKTGARPSSKPAGRKLVAPKQEPVSDSEDPEPVPKSNGAGPSKLGGSKIPKQESVSNSEEAEQVAKSYGARSSGANRAGPSTKPSAPKPVNGTGAGLSKPDGKKMVVPKQEPVSDSEEVEPVPKSNGAGPSQKVARKSMRLKNEEPAPLAQEELQDTPRLNESSKKRKASMMLRDEENEDPSRPGTSKKGKVEVEEGEDSEPKVKLEIAPPSELRWPMIELPSALKTILADDCLLMRKNIGTKVPANFSIDDIVDEHITQMSKFNPFGYNIPHPKLSLYKAAAKSMKDYINIALGTKLLYSSERPQFTRLKRRNGGNKAFRPSSIYGIVHLLRLLVNFPKLEVQPGWIQHDIDITMEGINKFVEFLGAHWEDYYNGAEDYENCTEERFKEIVENP